eukprot:TRINITY_DN10843_c0_g1_i2.p1 TRINITY_DN10843_c0_g1~~TRINITY_DN10843_c0_g1_i2.p1  ORF type:complete len:393 (-),score=38.98 TRINITY_DN10843_c0_g1_i2:195-1319(-)
MEKTPVDPGATSCLYLRFSTIEAGRDITEQMLMREFRDFRPVTSNTFHGKPFAFVHFSTAEDASRASNAMRGKVCGNPYIKIGYSETTLDVLKRRGNQHDDDRYREPSPQRISERPRSPRDDRKKTESHRTDRDHERNGHSAHHTEHRENHSSRDHERHQDRHHESHDREKRLREETSLPSATHDAKKVKQEERAPLESQQLPPSSPISLPASPVKQVRAYEGCLAKGDQKLCNIVAYQVGGTPLAELLPGGLPPVLNMKSRALLSKISEYIPQTGTSVIDITARGTEDERPLEEEFTRYLREKKSSGNYYGTRVQFFTLSHSIQRKGLWHSQRKLLAGRGCTHESACANASSFLESASSNEHFAATNATTTAN